MSKYYLVTAELRPYTDRPSLSNEAPYYSRDEALAVAAFALDLGAHVWIESIQDGRRTQYSMVNQGEYESMLDSID